MSALQYGIRRTLLMPMILSAKNRFFPSGSFPKKTIGVVIFCLLLCIILFNVTLSVVTYFHEQDELGIILSLKIFQMAWILIFAMLIFSCMVSAVSSVYLSQDNEIVFSAPISTPELYFMRYTSNTIYTSWMMIIFSLPIFAAYGIVFNTPLLYWLLMVITLLSMACSATCFGLLLTVILINLFPARHTKDIILYLSLCFSVLIIFLIRLLQPENMVNPEEYGNFIEYFSTISKPAAPYIPAGWAANFLSLYLLDLEIDWLLLGLLFLTPFTLYFLGEMAMKLWFFPGYSKSQESFGGHHKFGHRRKYKLGTWQWLFSKEAKIFARDSAEWSQLFMIAALVVIYLYNFKLLPIDRAAFSEEFITNLISFLNIGIAGFIITSLSARFVFPSIGAEGGAFYHIRSSPISIRRFLFYKYLFYVIPFTFLSLTLITMSNRILHIEGPMWWISIFTNLFITWAVVALALGFGAVYADFKTENKTVTMGSMGAIMFLLTATSIQVLIIFIGANPIYRIVRGWLNDYILNFSDLYLLSLWILTSVLITIMLVIYFFRKGIHMLGNL
ncbi:MAG: putative ABC transporter permease subunit [Candidatus Neomarinimicrobiota bacterium]